MSVAPNLTRQRLDEGRLVLGLGLRQARTVDIGLIARACGFDFLFIECEHSAIELSTACEISTAALGQHVTPIVRVASKAAFHATRVLDNGAQGVVIPHVDTAAEAADLVAALRYPPRGHRSIARASPLVGFETVPLDTFMRDADDATLLTVMLESPEAIEQADEIAAVPGVDALMIGTNDLCAEMGIHGQFGHERIARAYERLCAACLAHGKHAGMAGVSDRALMARYIGIGVRFVLAGMDIGLLMEAGRSQTAFLRALEPPK